MTKQTDEELKARIRLRDDFIHYAKHCLKIRTKDDGVKPFELNEAQRYVHDIAERQLRENGKVRIIVLKGRQQGMSTYIEGRYYWKVTHSKGARAYILTHESEATSNLFDMVDRYHTNNPPQTKPSTSKDSGKELHFDRLDSGYKVGTAGASETGRSQTIQYFHGSEVAFWPHAEKHARGVLQAVPKDSGEIFLESTSDGIGNYFYKVWRDAIAGKSDYEAVFVPWFWQSEYVSKVSDDFELDEEEREYLELVNNYYGQALTNEQLAFRRAKISELGSVESFKREYPATAKEAFESAANRQLINGLSVSRALIPKDIDPVGARILGVDVARFGDDSSVWWWRQGRYAKRLEKTEKTSLTETTGLTKRIIDKLKPDAVFIDLGMGAGVVDNLHEMGYDEVIGVNFGGESWQEMSDWLDDGPVLIDAEGDEADDIEMDLCSVEYKFDSKGRKVMEPKEKTKERLGESPDDGDGLGLTFAQPVAILYDDDFGYNVAQGRSETTGY
jgi:hypothetical protein